MRRTAASKHELAGFHHELEEMRLLLGKMRGSSDGLSMETFATALARTLGRTTPITQPTLWRWMHGRSVPANAAVVKIRAWRDELRATSNAAPTPRPNLIAAACWQARLGILTEELKENPESFEGAEGVALLVERLILSLAATGYPVTEADAARTIVKSVRGYIRSLKPAAGDLDAEHVTPEDAQLPRGLQEIVDLVFGVTLFPKGVTQLGVRSPSFFSPR